MHKFVKHKVFILELTDKKKAIQNDMMCKNELLQYVAI